MSSEIHFITDDSKIIYNSSKNGDYFGLRDIKKNTFEIYKNNKINDDKLIFTEMISININENKFPEMDSNKTFFTENYACLTTSDKICYLIDLKNNKKITLVNQSKITKVNFDELTKILGILLHQTDGSSILKFFKLNENYELDFINSIVHDDKTIIKDFAIFENNILISYKNILELRVFNKILITKNIYNCNEEISVISYFKNNNCIISAKSGNNFLINLNNKNESFIIKPTSSFLVKIMKFSSLEDAFVFSTFDMSLYIYVISENKLYYICDLPNIYLTSCCLRGDVISLGFLNGIVLTIWIGNVETPIYLKKFKINSYENGEETINNIWQYDLKNKLSNFVLGYQTTNGIFLLK